MPRPIDIDWSKYMAELHTLIADAVAAEREACAKVAHDTLRTYYVLKYRFTDEHGHPIHMCRDFLDMLREIASDAVAAERETHRKGPR